MSWFDTSGIANLAKSALKEAQKTIDKALDIKEDESRSQSTAKDDDTNFFTTWGIRSVAEGEGATGDSATATRDQESGIWGSFTGSFFENPKIDHQPRRSFERSESLEERGALRRIPEASGLASSASLQEDLLRSSSSVSVGKNIENSGNPREIVDNSSTSSWSASASSLHREDNIFDGKSVKKAGKSQEIVDIASKTKLSASTSSLLRETEISEGCLETAENPRKIVDNSPRTKLAASASSLHRETEISDGKSLEIAENPRKIVDNSSKTKLAASANSLHREDEISNSKSVKKSGNPHEIVDITSKTKLSKIAISLPRETQISDINSLEIAKNPHEIVDNTPRTKLAASASSLPRETDISDLDRSEKMRRYSAGALEGTDDKILQKDTKKFPPSVSLAITENNDFQRDSNSRAFNPDRASVISVCSESDKRSSDSVEVLGSHSGSNTDCTTTPESEVPSSSSSGNASSATPVSTKRNSESVEVLPDSLVTSPSSVEILGDSKTNSESPFLSPIDQRHFDLENVADSSSDVSPYASPLEEESKTPKFDSEVRCEFPSGFFKVVSNDNEANVSPESVEVIADADEVDETSQAEDSYTSASESTTMTVREANLKQQADFTSKPRLEFADRRMHVSCPDSGRQISSAVPLGNLNSSLDSLKEKHSLHLPLEPITRQPIGKGEFVVERMMSRMSETEASDQIKDSTIEPAADEETPVSEQGRSNQAVTDVGDCPEQHLMLTDSSCEGTLIESSSEDNITVVKTNEATVNETPLTASSYVKNMLADAMAEKGEIQMDGNERQRIEVPARESSPISSESRSDLVKIGSDQTSGHTSGDELETTTSSDIEIISRYSPNGDSSSTQSRQSPANLHSSKGTDLLTRTLKSRGHSRELSEISVGSDEVNFEIEKLLKRIQEMTEILEVRESKLIDVSRINMELHEQNISMKKELETIEMRAGQSQEVSRITEDYTQRLSALEKKFQQAIGERDSLREQLEQLKHEAATRLSSRETMTITAEKDEIIRELRAEGEKLSKQQLQHSNIIKKLRAKEKENETLIKSQKEQLEEQGSELERLKRSLYAKEEVERSQIEAVYTLTARNKKQEAEILSLQEKLDNALHKIDAYKTSFDAAKTDLTDSKAKLAAAEEELKRALENAGESCQLSAQVEDLKLKLRKSEEAHVRSVETLKRSNNELLKRFEAAEARSEELSESVTLATKPLLRQLEQLQASFVVKTNNFVKQEKLMSESIDELQAKLESLVATDRSLVEENLSLRSRVSNLESQVKRKESERTQVVEALEKLRFEYERLQETNSRQQKMLQSIEQANAEQVKELKREVQSLTDKLSVERAATDAEKRKNSAFVEQQHSVDEESRLSPTLSIGRDSIGSTSSVWPAFNESLFESGSGRFPSVYDSLRATGNSTSMIENLQAQVKQRDGEIQQLQWEMSRRNNERDALNIELSSLTLKIEELSSKVAEYEALNESLNEVQTRYDALLQMYGEKVEETEELRLDLEDVKEMYKSQIDQLLKRDAHY